MRRSTDIEKEALIGAAGFMAAAARTAPKTRSIDNVEIVLVDDDETKSRLVKGMREISAAEKRPGFERDANCVEKSAAVLIIGVKSNPAGLNCGYCGYPTCEELKKTKGICAYNSIDLGIAASSAVSMASQFHIDNRIMYSIGKASLGLGLFSGDTKQALGIPLSVTGKNPFFDRK